MFKTGPFGEARWLFTVGVVAITSFAGISADKHGEAEGYSNGSEAEDAPAGAALERQGVQEGASRDTLESESFRRRFARQRHRSGESVRLYC